MPHTHRAELVRICCVDLYLHFSVQKLCTEYAGRTTLPAYGLEHYVVTMHNN
jgi:hypothetical protein